MRLNRKILTVSGTVVCAVGTGFFMQQSAPADVPTILPQPVSLQQNVLAPTVAASADHQSAPFVQDIFQTSSLPVMTTPSKLPRPELQRDHMMPRPVSERVLPETPEDPEVPELGCSISSDTTVSPMAMVNLTVSAPCYGNQRVTIHHKGLMFTDTTDDNGIVKVTIPAFAENAVFMIAFANGLGTIAFARVTDLGSLERVGLQWGGDTGFQIHAREFGAMYGDAGHVSSDGAAKGLGFVTRLGSSTTLAPQMAEIYTFPAEDSERTGTIALSVEAEVTAANCGREISAQSFELRADRPLKTHNLTLSMPDCDARGDFLVLNNLVEDLKIAAK